MGFKSLAELRKGNSLENVAAQAEKMSKSGFEQDERYWRLGTDKAGNGSAIIRFLPASQGEDTPFVRLWTHSFKGPTGQWYIENSLTTIGGTDAVGESNSALWNSGNETDKEIARNRKRKLNYISNILVIKDPSNPENEGKVFLYKYGQKIFEKIKNLLQPEFEEETPVNPFDFDSGKNFFLRAKKVSNFPNYDDSKFADSSSPIAATDEAIEAIWNKQFPLQPEVAPDKFKSPEDLRKRFELVTGGKAPRPAAEKDDDPETPAPKPARAPKSEPPPIERMASKKHPLEEDDEDDEDDDTSYFQNLVK